MTVTIGKVDLRVKDIIDEALKAADPYWVGVTDGRVEILERKPVWMIGVGNDVWVSGNRLEWPADSKVQVIAMVIAKTKYGVPFDSGPITPQWWLNKGDTLVVAEGRLTVPGPLP